MSFWAADLTSCSVHNIDTLLVQSFSIGRCSDFLVTNLGPNLIVTTAYQYIEKWFQGILIAQALVLWSSCLYESWIMYKNLIYVTRISDFRSHHFVGSFIHFVLEECDGGRRRCRAYAAERPGFSIVEVLFILMLCWRQKILAVPHTSSAPRRGVHLVGSEQIWRRAPQITR